MAATKSSSPPMKKCMKYKRKFYEADDYLPWNAQSDSRGMSKTSDNNVSANTRNEEVKQDKTGKGSCFNDVIVSTNSDRSTCQTHAPDADVACPPKKRRISGSDPEPFTRTGDKGTESFLHTLENPHTTHEICMALLNMAFWRPDSESTPGQLAHHPDTPAVVAGITDTLRGTSGTDSSRSPTQLPMSVEGTSSAVGQNSGYPEKINDPEPICLSADTSTEDETPIDSTRDGDIKTMVARDYQNTVEWDNSLAMTRSSANDTHVAYLVPNNQVHVTTLANLVPSYTRSELRPSPAVSTILLDVRSSVDGTQHETYTQNIQLGTRGTCAQHISIAAPQPAPQSTMSTVGVRQGDSGLPSSVANVCLPKVQVAQESPTLPIATQHGYNIMNIAHAEPVAAGSEYECSERTTMSPSSIQTAACSTRYVSIPIQERSYVPPQCPSNATITTPTSQTIGTTSCTDSSHHTVLDTPVASVETVVDPQSTPIECSPVAHPTHYVQVVREPEDDSPPAHSPRTSMPSPTAVTPPSPSPSSCGSCGSDKPFSLFPKPSRGRKLYDIVGIMARRHKENYFVDWTAHQVLELPKDERPNIYPVTDKMKKDFISKSVVTENKKLSFSWYSTESWGEGFMEKLRNGDFKTLSEAKREASNLWRQHCAGYDGRRAVRMRDNEGNIIMKRTRATLSSEFEYRQNLRKAKVNTVVDQIWAKRAIIGELLSSDHVNETICDIVAAKPGYQPPLDKTQQLADIIAFTLRRELLCTNVE